jgi:hypothetical protein
MSQLHTTDYRQAWNLLEMKYIRLDFLFMDKKFM